MSDPLPHKGKLRLVRSAGGGRPEVWEVRYGADVVRVTGSEHDARAKMTELARKAKTPPA